MGSRLLWRRSATAVGLYSSVALGGLAVVAAGRLLGLEDFGLYTTLLAALGFFQSLLLLGVVTGSTQLGVFRIALAPQTGFSAVSSPVRLILLTEQTAGWERGDRRGLVRGVVHYTLAACAVASVSLPFFLWLMPDLIRIVFGSQYLGATGAATATLVSTVVFTLLWALLFARMRAEVAGARASGSPPGTLLS